MEFNHENRSLFQQKMRDDRCRKNRAGKLRRHGFCRDEWQKSRPRRNRLRRLYGVTPFAERARLKFFPFGLAQGELQLAQFAGGRFFPRAPKPPAVIK